MAKCLICNSRKGKRKCIAQGGFICSLCCGESRSFDKCDGCSYFKEIKSSRNYRKVPYFPVSRMSNDFDLQDQANVIESAICQFDDEQNRNLNDKSIIKFWNCYWIGAISKTKTWPFRINWKKMVMLQSIELSKKIFHLYLTKRSLNCWLPYIVQHNAITGLVGNT